MTNHVNPVARILNLVSLERKEISAIYFYAILSGLIQLSLPLGVQAIIGFVLGGSMTISLVLLITLVVAGVLCTGLLQIGQMQVIEKVEQKIFVHYSFDFARRIPQFDLKKTDAYYLPELVNRFFEIPSLQKGLSKLMLDIPAATIQILFGLLLLSFYHPAFILFGLVLVLILWLILYYTGNKGLQTSLAESSYKYQVAAWLEELARLIKSFKFSKGSSINLQKTDEKVSGYLDARNKHFNILRFQFGILVAFKVLITAAMLIVGAILLVNQQLNIGQFIAAEIIIITVIASVEKLIGNLDSVYDVMTSVEKIAKLTDKPIEPDGSYILSDEQHGFAIEAKALSFGYNNQKKIIDNLSFSIQPGEKVYVTGREGSGKSTLLKLMSGSYNDFEGALLINDVPIGNYDLSSLRARTGIFLSQQDIFHGTLLENISMGNKEIDMQQVIRLFKVVGLSDFFAAQKEGFDTWLDPTGKKLPRNVIHKILLVRALTGKPRLLLLEDPWSGIEEPYRSNIMQLLLNEYRETTTVIVTTDTEFTVKCNKVIEIITPSVIDPSKTN
ncbi:MAG: ATP-binding cassette domain-containing protein [Chitinophagaceae bacterium]|nr:ATP-binding cassette domain-containing protein [Chitinophagaceae bacterium]